MFINLDANASASLLPEVKVALERLLGPPLNPSSIHRLGQAARGVIEEARSDVRALLDLGSHDRVIFTSGATEANTTALRSVFCEVTTPTRSGGDQAEQDGAMLVTSSVEHQSVLGPAASLEQSNIRVARIPVSSEGELEEGVLERVLGAQTRLVSLMLANNETGHVYPIARISKLIRSKAPHALLHSDAVQMVGKERVSFHELGVDMLTISGHKLGALAGVGALVLREGVTLNPLLVGGSQELYLRAGTENVLGILSLGVAARVVRSTLEERTKTMRTGIRFMREVLSRELPGIRWNTPCEGALPNTLSMEVPGILADDLLVALDLKGVCVSSGAACSSGKPLPSHVLRALGKTEEQARSTIRISVEPRYAEGQLEHAASTIVSCIKRFWQGTSRMAPVRGSHVTSKDVAVRI